MLLDDDRSTTIRVRPTCILSIPNRRKSILHKARHKVIRSDANGILSVNATRKLRNAMRWLIACSSLKQCYEKEKKRMVDYRINMCTLTFKKNMQDDEFARKLLGMWLDMAKHRFGLERYIWKAEPQERGAIHFHLCCGVYLPYKEVCYTWNRLLYRNGIRQVNANSTDVHAVEEEWNAEAYLTDYLMNEAKHSGRRRVTGRLWGCDRKLSKAGKFSLHYDKYDREGLYQWLSSKHLRHKVDLPFLKFIDYYIMYEHDWKNMPDCDLKLLYMAELNELRPSSVTPEFW